jgi:hypothetical protein
MMRNGICLLLMALFLLTADGTAAGAEKLALGGGEVAFGDADSHYLYAGLLVPWPGHRLGDGLVQRYWVDHFSYQYDADGQRIEAEGVGMEGVLGWTVSGERGYAGVYAGLRLVNTELSPDDPSSRVQGTHLRPKALAVGEVVLSPDWRAGGFASFTFGARAYWTTMQLKRRAGGSLFTGPLAVFHGDPDYTAWNAGWGLWGLTLPFLGELSLQGGIRVTGDRDTGPFFGIGLARVF